MSSAVDDQIIAYLEAHPDKTAREIAAVLGMDKKVVNARLYGPLKGQTAQDSKYRWRLVAAGADPQDAPAATFADTDLARLSRYYLACLGQDGLGVSVFAESKFSPNYMELPNLPSGGSDFWDTEAARTMLGQVRRDRSRLVLYLGYPTTLHLRRSKKSSWQGYMVEPIFIFPVQLDDQMRPTLDIGFPSINQNVVSRFTNASPQDVMNELVRLEEELGLADANFAPELDELISRLHAIRPEWPWLEAPDTEQFSAEPSLPQLQQEGIVNRAVLLITERSPFTQGLESELTQLARQKPGATDDTALGDWIVAAAPRKVAEVPPPLEVLPMNLEQREAVAAALGSSLTIITGPPGTGKSQVVTNLLLNAVWNGKRVLFASKNNKAVDVVEQRVNNLGPRPVLLRLGSNQYQSALAEYLMTLLASATSASDHEEYQDAVARHEQLQKRLASVNQKVERLIELRNQTDRLDQEVEDFRGELGDESFAALRSLDADTVEHAVQHVSAAVEAADVNCQSGFTRLVWPLLRNGRMAALSAAVAACKDVLAQMALSAPTVEPSDDTMTVWQAYREALEARVGETKKVLGYFASLKELEDAPSLETLGLEASRTEKAMSSNASRLWSGWLRLQPDRMSHDDRLMLNRYAGTLKMVMENNGEGKLPPNVYKEYNSLFPKVSHMLSCWAVTSLSAKGRIPFEPGYFDLVVFDEASQCDIASALPLLYRAKQAVVIGDPKQLSHITGMVRGQDQQLLDKFGLTRDFPHWSFSFNSLFELAAGMSSASAVINLRDHHRSHADIIGFSNDEFYEGRLRVATAYEGLKRPDPKSPGISWVPVSGKVTRPATGGAENAAEAREIARVLRDLVLVRGYEGSVGVVTPFRAQANLIREVLNEDPASYETLVRQGLLVDTVHKFQGDERDLMVFSPVLSDGTSKGALGFLASNGNLFNVAITRARGQLLVVGDLAACAVSEVGYLARFAQYVRDLQERERVEREHSAQELGPRYPAVSNPEQVSEWEVVLYEALYRRGIRPLPQYGVEKYRLDFALFEGDRKLNIEVDGERYHRNWTGELCRRDQLRNQRMYELGWDVMRFWVYEVRDDLERCVEKVNAWLEGNTP